jgi:MtN3 and saliva related transmembrane protein
LGNSLGLIGDMNWMAESIGWGSSIILLATIGKQVHKQWSERTSAGVSKWLFIGQVAASVGFTTYSWLLHNWVFVVTNALMLINGLVGLVVVMHQRRARRRGIAETAQIADSRAG